jgi:hypothetical protein
VRQNTSFKSSLGWGVAGGLGLATLFSGFVGLMALWRGSDWNPTYQVSTWSVIRGYYVAGLLGGLTFGILRPLFWGRVGGLVLGLLLGPLVYGAVSTVVEGSSRFGAPSAIIPGLFGGAITGWWLSRPGGLP